MVRVRSCHLPRSGLSGYLGRAVEEERGHKSIRAATSRAAVARLDWSRAVTSPTDFIVQQVGDDRPERRPLNNFPTSHVLWKVFIVLRLNLCQQATGPFTQVVGV